MGSQMSGKISVFRDENVRLVTHFSIRCFLFVNIKCGHHKWFVCPVGDIPKKQTVINTWHGGGAYKNWIREKDI